MSLTLDPAIPSTARASSVAARTLTAGGLFAIAAVHLMDLPGKEPSYLAVLYVGLVLVCVGVATRLVMRPDPTTWLAAVAIPLATMAAYAVTRTVGLPGATGDIGNWTEPLGIAALACEAATAWCAVLGLLALRRGQGRDLRTLPG